MLKGFLDSAQKVWFNFPHVYLNVSVERASFGEDLSAVRTDDPVYPVGDPDVGV